MHLFIFGLGYSSLAIATLAMRRGFSVSGTTRSAEKAERLRGLGIEAFLFPSPSPRREEGLMEETLASATHILSSIPPQEGVDSVLPLIDSSARYLAYLSTTGVYGDWGGEWVDEASELRAGNARLRGRVAAENAWRARGGHVFRLAGIYGPGRSAIEDIRAGGARRIDKPGQVFSRIHVEDIAQAVVASMEKPNPGSVYNVCDDMPAPSHEVVAYGCGLLGVEPPPLVPFAQAELSPMGREFYAANRRVRNDKIKAELGVSLLYPDYRAGLAQCLQAGLAE
jgi:nucleoside-diphosphate-sugar epimerase